MHIIYLHNYVVAYSHNNVANLCKFALKVLTQFCPSKIDKPLTFKCSKDLYQFDCHYEGTFT